MHAMTRLILMCVTHSHMSASYHTYENESCHTGWRRLIGSPKLQIIFHKRATKYKSLLQKMTYKDKGSYESSPPCTDVSPHRTLRYRVVHTRREPVPCSVSSRCSTAPRAHDTAPQLYLVKISQKSVP